MLPLKSASRSTASAGSNKGQQSGTQAYACTICCFPSQMATTHCALASLPAGPAHLLLTTPVPGCSVLACHHAHGRMHHCININSALMLYKGLLEQQWTCCVPCRLTRAGHGPDQHAGLQHAADAPQLSGTIRVSGRSNGGSKRSSRLRAAPATACTWQQAWQCRAEHCLIHPLSHLTDINASLLKRLPIEAP